MWEQIRANQTRSVVLTIGMGALLILIGYFLGLYFFDNAFAGLVIAILVWTVLSLVGYFQGDSILLRMSRAKKIKRDDHPRLYNIVEEMKIASGLEKMPDIYIIDDPALNAFATGRDPNRASVAITSGLLQKLNRDELQGVIGHELAHIKNRDVLLAMNDKLNRLIADEVGKDDGSHLPDIEGIEWSVSQRALRTMMWQPDDMRDTSCDGFGRWSAGRPQVDIPGMGHARRRGSVVITGTCLNTRDRRGYRCQSRRRATRHGTGSASGWRDWRTTHGHGKARLHFLKTGTGQKAEGIPVPVPRCIQVDETLV